MTERILSWLLTHAVLGLATFFISMGASFAFLWGASSGPQSVPQAKRILSQVLAVMFVSIGAGYAIDVLCWNAYLVCALGFVLGMGAEKICLLLLDVFKKSTSFPDFFRRLYEAYQAFRNTNPHQNS